MDAAERPSEEDLENFDEEDERTLDAVWAELRREFPDYSASPEVEWLKRLPAERAARYATLPPYEERRRADKMRREAGFDLE